MLMKEGLAQQKALGRDGASSGRRGRCRLAGRCRLLFLTCGLLDFLFPGLLLDALDLEGDCAVGILGSLEGGIVVISEDLAKLFGVTLEPGSGRHGARTALGSHLGTVTDRGLLAVVTHIGYERTLLHCTLASVVQTGHTGREHRDEVEAVVE